MLNCDLCDYFKMVKSETGASYGVCEYTGFEFYEDIQDYEIEYPCSDFEVNEDMVEIEKRSA
jgi:hypothetical protein